ncbi:hypothetical protein [Mesorhizobium amorphae]|uniref:hypothetical protein n=1 Tax=Mesorhizobium amorphae TaxID=71433 RepID=UPI001183BC9B|nr:hypothetical protein [Mesorhizobium amorphae]
MTIHVTYQAWTYEMVRERIIEAAETLLLNPASYGPRLIGMALFGEYKDEYLRGEGTRVRRTPSAHALAEMEETWSWINDWLPEKDRKLVYDYGFIMSRKGLTLKVWCERNGWIKRTFERAVSRCCQRIADELNRKYHVRLTMPFDALSQIRAKHASFEVASDSRAPVKPKLYHRADDATPTHTPGSEADIAKHIEKVNQQRREEAERQRKAALTRAEEEAKLAAAVEARLARKRQKQVA